QRKFDLQKQLEALEQDIQRVAQQYRSQTPGASEQLNKALAEEQGKQTSARLSYGAEAILAGEGPRLAATETVTTSALRDLQRDTEAAAQQANEEAVAGQGKSADPNAELVAKLQSLRRQLSDLTQPPQQQQLPGPGQNGQQQAQNAQNGNGQQPGQGQQGQQQGQGQQAGNGNGQANAAGGNQFGGAFGSNYGAFGPGGPRGWYDPRRGGIWDPRNAALWQNPQTVQQARDQLSEASRELLTLGSQLRNQGVSEEELKAIRELGEALRAGLGGNPDLIPSEFQKLVNLTDQLELKLTANDNGERASVRSQAPAHVTEGFEDAVAEYFRRLSRGNQPQP
ncbi:MAG TPA: hypothetical protein VL131_04145, partial [Gammaproteobacteria bacterium]|nr:hypothetical protein [Gammaproteobacteria bacterium]